MSLMGGKLSGLTEVPFVPGSYDLYFEPARRLPVYGRFDVIVVGEGPVGFVSALARAGVPCRNVSSPLRKKRKITKGTGCQATAGKANFAGG
jgi:hypothetical protein